MPCGPRFLNGDVPPPPFPLSLPFNMVTSLAFRVRFGFLTEKSRPWNPFQIFPPSALPPPPLLPVPGPQGRKTLLLSGFQRQGEKPCWDSKKSTGKWLVQKFSSTFAPDNRPRALWRAWEVSGPEAWRSHLQRVGLRVAVGGPVPVWVRSPLTSLPISPTPALPSPNLLYRWRP